MSLHEAPEVVRRSMKIGLIFPNKDRKDKTVHLGLGYIASYARSIHPDLDITILDTRVATTRESKAFFRQHFDLVGITVLSPVYYEVISIAKSVREHDSSAKICLGGPYVTTIMEDVFRDVPADYAVFGEGEITFSELLFYLRGQKEVEEIRGLMYKLPSGAIVKNEAREQIPDLDQLPMPAYDLFPMNRYPMHRIVTSRGCPYKCSFCNSSSVWQYKWRARSAGSLVAEIEYLINNHNQKTFCFNDNSFNIDTKRVDEFCERILDKNVRFLWSTPVRVEKITHELARKMKKAGCYTVGIGIESANNSILAAMGKQVTIEEITKGIGIFQGAGIEVLGQFVIGSPGDTPDSVEESIKYAKNSTLDYVMFYSVLPFKGTPQWDYVKRHGTLNTENIHDFHTINPRIVFETPEFSYRQRMDAIRMATDEGYYCDSNARNFLFDLGRDMVKNIQRFLPYSISSRIYLSGKKIYRKSGLKNRMMQSKPQ